MKNPKPAAKKSASSRNGLGENSKKRKRPPVVQPKPTKHKDSLAKLKQQDPEFYKFLENEDKKLLNFSDSDADNVSSASESADERNDTAPEAAIDEEGMDFEGESSEEDSESSDDVSSDDDGTHKPPRKLEVASDTEEEEDSDQDDGDTTAAGASSKGKRDQRIPVTVKLINKWTMSLRENSTGALIEVIQAFRAAVQCAGSDVVEKSRYRVKGGTIFNAIVRLCLKELPPMLNRHLKLPKPKNDNKIILPSNSPQWRPLRKHVMSYLTDLIELLSQLGEADILNVVLKHVSQMVSCYACFPKLGKSMLRKLIKLWSSGEESTRVLAFLSINRLVRLKQEFFMEFTLKQMYMAYVKNCKFTSPTTLPLINFMQRSLVEVFAVDQDLTYQYAFMYIRQLAIHLRNAITVNKKETCQLVYNWQYVHSLQLWGRTLSQLYPSDVLEPLIYPLVQTIIGTVKLIPTAKYYPLRFHCVRTLNMLSASTRTFIPVLPFLVELFDLTNFTKKQKSASMKPFNFACIIKMSKSQLREKSFEDGVIDQVYEHLMEAYHTHAHTIGFPELVLPSLLQLKKFTKTCKVANYTKQIRQIADKVQETANVITQRRKTASLSLSDNKAIRLWEERSKQEGTPLGKFYATWRKLRDRELQHEVADRVKVSAEDLPLIERRKSTKKPGEKVDFSKIFESGSEDSDDESRFLPPEERPKKKLKKSEDDYTEFSEKELAKLAESASESDEDGSEGSIEVESDDSEVDDGSSLDEEEDEDDDEEDQEDIVEDFQFSSDEER